MKRYLVETEGTSREVWSVEAIDEDDAWDRFMEGDVVISEVTDTGMVVGVTPDE